MYWTHLTFALIHGLLLSWSEIAASKPGYLDFDNLPETNFSCDGKVIGGYYADVETGCQMFHVCTIGQKGEVTDIKFLCLNGTVFDQETRVCERIDEVDCAKSEDFFGLNLELYNNHASFGGIQPEAEFECGEECSETEEYEEPTTAPSSTTAAPTSTTTAPSSSPPAPSGSSSTSAPSQRETLQALLALHSALSKPAPPRLINNAFSPRPAEFKPRDSHSYGSLNLQQRERPYYFTPSTEKSNYHHFHSGDTSFGHSLDATRPYNFQYFHSRKLPEEKPSVSVVTSTSTSTSVKTSKTNATDFPTGYEDYQDDVQDHAFFQDVPKLRQKREVKHPNHRYDDDMETTTPRHRNHKYNDETSNEREEFLQNLLGSIDLDEKVREKMTDFFKKEDKEMDKFEKEGNSLSEMGNTIGQIFTEGMDILKTNGQKSKADKLSEWTKHFDDMKKDINLNYTFEVNFTSPSKREKRDTLRTGNSKSTITPLHSEERIQPRRTNIDTEKFQVETRRRKTGPELKPVSESIEDDLTTVEYRRSSKRARSQPRSTTSLRAWTFNYEATTALPSGQDPPASAEILDIVHEEVERRPVGSGRRPATRVAVERRPATRLGVERRPVLREQEVEGRPVTRLGVERRPVAREHRVERRPVAREHGVERRPVVREHGVERGAVTDQEVEKRPVPEQGVERRPVVEEQESIPVTGEEKLETYPLSGEKGIERRLVEEEQGVERRPTARDHGAGRRLVAGEENVERPGLGIEKAERGGVQAGRPVEEQVDDRPRKESRRVARVRQRRPSTTTKELVPLTTQPTPVQTLAPDPSFSCEGKVKGGFYADMYNDCRAFFICSQGEINGPLLKSHFACGSKTKFNQRSRTCQAEDLVECEISKRYFHLNNDFLVPASEDELRGGFEPMKEG